MIAGLSLIVACDEEPQNRAAGGWGGAAKVVTERIELRPLVDEIEALGTAKANESVEIRPRVSSLVTRIRFEEGQFVEQGDLLLELENSEIVAGLALAEASLSESRG
jgi:membrane fusion protein (multidrug efflux system)